MCYLFRLIPDKINHQFEVTYSNIGVNEAKFLKLYISGFPSNLLDHIHLISDVSGIVITLIFTLGYIWGGGGGMVSTMNDSGKTTSVLQYLSILLSIQITICGQ